MTRNPQTQNRRMRGFEQAAGLLLDRNRASGETRGNAESRLLTHRAEIVGPETAGYAHPVRIGYARGGMGATLTLLCSGAAGPMMQMRLPALREKVNACYGYNAVSRIVITQTAPTGFAEGQMSFAPAPPLAASPDPAIRARAAEVSGAVQDAGLRAALAALGENVLNRARPR